MEKQYELSLLIGVLLKHQMSCTEDNKVLISKSNNENTVCFFHVYRLGMFMHFSLYQLILQYLSSLTEFTILNLYYLTLSKHCMIIV